MLACRTVSQSASIACPPEMDDAVDARAHGLAGGEVGEVGHDHLLARAGRCRRHAVGQAQQRIDAGQVGAQPLPDAAGRTGDQYPFHCPALLHPRSPSIAAARRRASAAREPRRGSRPVIA